jgi:pantoate--beta-alanine ligase
VDYIFHPSVKEMYPVPNAAFVNVERITDKLCGLSRPGHFRGVATVVTKLFNIITPDVAYFGQKDAQQALVILRMVADLNMTLAIKVVPIVREADGLALSSRNVFLSPAERQAALVLSRSLRHAEQLVAYGERDLAVIRQSVVDLIKAESLAKIDYVEILNYPDLEPIPVLQSRALLAVAVKFGITRLIDNTILEVAKC